MRVLSQTLPCARRAVLRLAAAALLLAAGAASAAAQTSPWTPGRGAAIRLLAGERQGATISAGLEIRLEPGWKTYWRYPGDSGVAPTFDWSASRNLAKVEVAWPAPHLFTDEGGTSIGYKGDVILPLAVTAADPAKPVELALALDYATCERICVPDKGEARLDIGADTPADPAAAASLRAAAADVPRPARVGQDGAPTIAAVTLDDSRKPPRLLVTAKASPGAFLLADGPADWYLPVPERTPGADQFVLALDGLPRNAVTKGAQLRFTLVDGTAATETVFTIP